ncbi:hypothetical protein VTJ49DRAFT_3473 [Mycothermus thermophilus]|uniref:Rhodopsin domain-containing protein n=1 Tax=Humicola insolens TaxID=85995 RepID=A0ABR3VN83_HUMIN
MADTQTPAPRWRGVGFPNHGADDQGWKLYITSLVMIISAGLFVIARIATRLVRNSLGWDDWTIVFSLSIYPFPQANSIVLSVAIQLAVSWGYGMHKADLTKAELETCLRWFFIAQTPYKVVVFLNKVSVVLLYMRIFVGNSFRIAAYAVLFVIFGYSIGGIAATIWQCVPIEGAWNKAVPAKCIDSNSFWVAYAVLNILTDVMVLALPVVPVMKLQLRWRERFLILGVFLLGAFVTITSILRVTSVQNSLKNRQDQTWSFIERGVWTLIESNLGIICACLPVLKQPLGKLFPRLFGSTLRGHSGVSSEGKYRHTDDSRGAHPNNSSTPTLSKVQGSSNPRFWRAPLKHQLSVSVSANRDTMRRGSDEHRIIGGNSDTGSDNIELGDRAAAAAEKGKISKTVELTRTSFHEARH